IGGEPSPTADASSLLETQHDAPRVTLRLPFLRPLEEYVPHELERYRKYLHPEPFRPMTVIAGVHELESLAGRLAPAPGGDRPSDETETEGPLPALRSFVGIVVAFLLRETLQGRVPLGPKSSVRQRGVELVRALFSAACRTKFPEYRTLITHRHWTDLL